MTAGNFFLVQHYKLSSMWHLVLDKYLQNEGFKDRNGLCPRGVSFFFPTITKTIKTTADRDKCHEINKQQMCGLIPKTINSQGWDPI